MTVKIAAPRRRHQGLNNSQPVRVRLSHALAGRKLSGASMTKVFSGIRLPVRRSYDVIQERVWTVTFFSHFGAHSRSRELVSVLTVLTLPNIQVLDMRL